MVPLDLDSICLHELVVTSGFASTPRSWRRAERLVGSGLVRLEPLVSDVVGLSRWDEAVARAAPQKVSSSCWPRRYDRRLLSDAQPL